MSKLPVAETPFDAARLDRLMEEASLDWVLGSSEHNTRYLLGGYSYFFHEHAQAIGLSRYLPLVAYKRGDPGQAFYVAAAGEWGQLQVQPIWVQRVETAEVTSRGAAEKAASLMIAGGAGARIGIEPSFLPGDAMAALGAGLPGAELVDATAALEALRSIKTAAELELLRRASEGIVGAMGVTFDRAHPGISKHALASLYEQEITARGLIFDYALITAGKSLNRAPFGGAWERGEMLSFDSGGRLKGYVGDLCRMAVMGRPDARMTEALEEVDAVQQAARSAVRPGALGGEIYAAADRQLSRSPHREHMRFVAHGMGLITHEAPRLTDRAVAPYPATHSALPLEPGMVLSIETHIADSGLGFVKLEDTIFVTGDGCEAQGDSRRGWNVAGGLA
jgi:Xaa-Pro aminopeptidase